MAILEMGQLNKADREAKLERLLSEFSLTHVRKNLGDRLSGGEKRRTEIARALATDPKFVLLDEPFAGVDPIAVEDIQAIVSALKKRNIGILITDHNVQETLSINPDRVDVCQNEAVFTDLSIDATTYQYFVEDRGVRVKLPQISYSAPVLAVGQTGAITATATTTTTAPKAAVVTTTLRKGASSSLATLIRPIGKGKATWRATGGCRISGTKLVAPTKASKCTLTLSQAKLLKTPASKRTISISVK